MFLFIILLALCGCSKVPLQRFFPTADIAVGAWFEREQTLFLFYNVSIEDGFEDDARIEVNYRTDDGESGFVRVDTQNSVHTHLPVNCGTNHICGSQSLAVTKRALEVELRVRYTEAGRLTDPIPFSFQTVESTGAVSDLSATLYGVFDEKNVVVQWRLRHQIPGILNETVRELGLKREFRVGNQSYGPRFNEEVSARPVNPYGFSYSFSQIPCPSDFVPFSQVELSTQEPAKWAEEALPTEGSAAALACAPAVLTSAAGDIPGRVLALKNPETETGFGSLSTTVRETNQLKFLLSPCGRTISSDHLDMQTQRLLMDREPDVCLDRIDLPTLTTRMSSTFNAALDRERGAGQDLSLLIAFHHDEPNPNSVWHQALQQALEDTFEFESSKSSPRGVGAYVFDSYSNAKLPENLGRRVLWCPIRPLTEEERDAGEQSNESQQVCPVLPNIGVTLGAVDLGVVPIFAERSVYLDFIRDFGVRNAGTMQQIWVRAPLATPETETIEVGQFAVATFFDGEVLSTSAEQRFSYCADLAPQSPLAFRLQKDAVAPEGDQSGLFEPDSVLPLSSLPDIHRQYQFSNYDLGLLWDFPFLFSFQYETVVSGRVRAFGGSVPFGIDRVEGDQYGSEIWTLDSFAVGDVLLKCARFCDHATFDSAGVYNISVAFDIGYANRCYRPKYPTGGFGSESAPLDP